MPDFPKDSKYYIVANNVVVGKMKDETGGVLIKGFVGLKSKMYTLITEDNHECKKAKGIKKNAAADELKHDYYKIFLFNRSYLRLEINRTQSKNIYT